MTRVIMLQGPFMGRALDIAPASATAGKADLWAVPLSDGYPVQTGNSNPKAKPPASYDAWVAAGMPQTDPVTGAVVLLTKANPSVLTLSTPDFAKFVTGDKVKFSGTGVPAIHGPTYTLGVANGTNKTFVVTGLDLSGQPADLATGTVTKV
jgi:hypothetical protein